MSLALKRWHFNLMNVITRGKQVDGTKIKLQTLYKPHHIINVYSLFIVVYYIVFQPHSTKQRTLFCWLFCSHIRVRMSSNASSTSSFVVPMNWTCKANLWRWDHFLFFVRFSLLTLLWMIGRQTVIKFIQNNGFCFVIKLIFSPPSYVFRCSSEGVTNSTINGNIV